MIKLTFDINDPELTRNLEESIRKLDAMFPTTTINGRRVPICKKCGKITDMSPIGSRDCRHCLNELVKDLVFNI